METTLIILMAFAIAVLAIVVRLLVLEMHFERQELQEENTTYVSHFTNI